MEARDALEAQASSGLSMAEFAVREGLKVERLLRWRRELGATTIVASPPFVELRRSAEIWSRVVFQRGVERPFAVDDQAAATSISPLLNFTPSMTFAMSA